MSNILVGDYAVLPGFFFINFTQNGTFTDMSGEVRIFFLSKSIFDDFPMLPPPNHE